MNDLYEEELGKVIGQRNELANILSEVLDAWGAVDHMAMNYKLYANANDYLVRLGYDTQN